MQVATKQYGKLTGAQMLKKLFHMQLTSYMDIIEMSRKGVTKSMLVDFTNAFNFSMEECADLLPITRRTIQRYSSNHKFNPIVSEQIIQLALLMTKGSEVFGSREKFGRWFNSPSKALGGKVPRELASLKTGAQMVMDELGRIEHGVYS